MLISAINEFFSEHILLFLNGSAGDFCDLQAVETLLSSGADADLKHSHGIGSSLCAATFTQNEAKRSPDARIALVRLQSSDI